MPFIEGPEGSQRKTRRMQKSGDKHTHKALCLPNLYNVMVRIVVYCNQKVGAQDKKGNCN